MSNEKRVIIETIQKLGYSVAYLHECTKIPAQRMYKWFNGEALPKAKDYKILEQFIENTRNPTNDFGTKNISFPKVENLTMAEEGVPILPPYWAKEIERLESKIAFLIDKINSRDETIETYKNSEKYLKDLLEDYRQQSKVNAYPTSTKRRSA